MKPIIESIDLVTNFYTYEGVVKALNKISLSIKHGLTLGLVGESGCGKSVFVRSLMRIIQSPGKIDAGEILLSTSSITTDILTQSEAYMQQLRGSLISMIFQEPHSALNPLMTVGEQIAESFMFHQQQSLARAVLNTLSTHTDLLTLTIKPLMAILISQVSHNPQAFIVTVAKHIPLVNHYKQLLKREALNRSVEILKKLHIAHPEEVVHLYPHSLSGGMKQRIVIAIALACSPVLLIADEPTSNLDVTIQAQILDLLRELKKTAISSILFITHDLGVVAQMCEEVGVMYAGNVCELADVRTIFAHPLHPYTRALIEAVPKFSQQEKLSSIEGSVPNLVHPPHGCRFHPRCPQVMQQCSLELPVLEEYEPGHFCACHYVKSQHKEKSSQT